jgi:hypothetical protein
MLKNGEPRKYTAACPFDCERWDECVCENTALRDGGQLNPAECFFKQPPGVSECG